MGPNGPSVVVGPMCEVRKRELSAPSYAYGAPSRLFRPKWALKRSIGPSYAYGVPSRLFGPKWALKRINYIH